MNTQIRLPVLAALVCVAASAYAPSTSAQSTLYEQFGVPGQLNLSIGLAIVGDLDGDGYRDYVATDSKLPSQPSHPIFYAFSSKSGATLFTRAFPSAASGYGLIVGGVSDVTGDGIPDFAIGCIVGCTSPDVGIPALPGSGGIHVYSGADGSFVRANSNGPGQKFGAQIFSLGDVNANGFGDYAVRGVTPTGQHVFRAFDGQGDVLLYTMVGSGTQLFGQEARSLPDLDMDGVPEVALGDPNIIHPTLTAPGAVRVYSGSSGVEFQTVYGPIPTGNVGTAFDSIGDVNGDHWPDFAARRLATPTNRIAIISGANGSLLAPEILAPVQGFFGLDLACVGDVDGDGWGDFVTSSQGLTGVSPNELYCFSSRTGQLLYRRVNKYPLMTPGIEYPDFLLALDDLTGDGFAEWLVGARDIQALNAGGSVEVVTTQSLVSTTSIVGTGASATMTLDVNAGLKNAGVPYYILCSYTGTNGINVLGAPMPLQFDALTELGIQFANTSVFAEFFGTTTSTGRADAVFDASALPAAADGLTFHFAALLAPNGGTASSTVAVSVTVDM